MRRGGFRLDLRKNFSCHETLLYLNSGEMEKPLEPFALLQLPSLPPAHTGSTLILPVIKWLDGPVSVSITSIPDCLPHSSAWATITKYQRLGGLNNRHLFLTVLESGQSKIKVQENSGHGEGPLPGL